MQSNYIEKSYKHEVLTKLKGKCDEVNKIQQFNSKSTNTKMGQSIQEWKGCLPQILLGLFWNTLSQISWQIAPPVSSTDGPLQLLALHEK